MSRGMTVIASDCKYGPPEIIEKNKYGLLVPVGSISDMGEAIVSLLLNRTKRSYYSQMALKRSKYYSREKMLKTYNNVLISLLSS
jgi:glycosyltransferase involved in cell wall biosynthesis